MHKKMEEYDIRALREARQRIMSVYGYYYSARGYAAVQRRLETILNKLESLISMVGDSNDK